MQDTGEIAGIAGMLQAFGGLVVGLIVIILLLRGGSIKRLFFGRRGEDSFDDWLKARKKAKESREEVNAILLANGIDPKDVNNGKKRDIL